MAIVLQYDESGNTYSQTFSTLAVRGMDEPDSLRKVAVLHECLNGNLIEQVRGFRKEPITISFLPPYNELQMRFLVKWLLASSKRIVYQTLISEGVTDDALISHWLYDCELGRAFDVQLFDEHVFTQWQFTPSSADDIMYCKLNVKITGTSLIPQTFTTGTAPIALMETGASWPVFSNTTHVHTVVLTPNGNCQFTACLIGNPTVSSGNVTFQAFVSDYQVPASDGFFYVDVKIFLQVRP